MTVKGLIFDLDGVIVFTDQYHYKAWKQMADEKGIYFDQEINNRLRGVSRMESLEIILERYEGEPLSDEDKQKMAEEKNEIYKKLLEQMTPADVSDEVKETLDELRKRGYLLSIGSSSKNAKYILERTGIMDKFDAVSDGTNITRSGSFLKSRRVFRFKTGRMRCCGRCVCGNRCGSFRTHDIYSNRRRSGL